MVTVFFNAAVLHTPDSVTSQQLREEICSHLLSNESFYVEFLPEDSTKGTRGQIFRDEVNSLKQKSHWSNDVADCLPLALANVT